MLNVKDLFGKLFKQDEQNSKMEIIAPNVSSKITPLAIKIDKTGKIFTNLSDDMQEKIGKEEFTKLCKLVSCVALLEMQDQNRVLH